MIDFHSRVGCERCPPLIRSRLAFAWLHVHSMVPTATPALPICARSLSEARCSSAWRRSRPSAFASASAFSAHRCTSLDSASKSDLTLSTSASLRAFDARATSSST